MSAASVAVVVTSGKRHEGKAGMMLFAGTVKLCDPCLSALCVPWCKKAIYKYSSFPSFTFHGPSSASLSCLQLTAVRDRPLDQSSVLFSSHRVLGLPLPRSVAKLLN